MSNYVEFGLCPIQFGLDSTLKLYDLNENFVRLGFKFAFQGYADIICPQMRRNIKILVN